MKQKTQHSRSSRSRGGGSRNSRSTTASMQMTLSQASTVSMGNSAKKKKNMTSKTTTTTTDSYDYEDYSSSSSILSYIQNNTFAVSDATNKHKNINNNTPTNNTNTKSLITLDFYETLVNAEIEETAIDVAIDQAIWDFTGLQLDCAILKENPFVRHWLRRQAPKYDDHGNVIEDDSDGCFPESNDTKCGLLREGTEEGDNHHHDIHHHYLSTEMAHQRESWMLLTLDLIAAQARTTTPIAVTQKMAHRIRALPERDVTLYIRLDEEIPKNSCTVYEVDMERFTSGKRDKLFRYFRICSCRGMSIGMVPNEKDDDNDDNNTNHHRQRINYIAGTLASACLHPYSMVPGVHDDDDDNNDPQKLRAVAAKACLRSHSMMSGGIEDYDEDQGFCDYINDNDISDDHDNAKQLKKAPFRPKLVMLDDIAVVKSSAFKCYMFSMGITKWQVVDPLLRELHEESDLDFFHCDEDLALNLDDDEDDGGDEPEHDKGDNHNYNHNNNDILLLGVEDGDDDRDENNDWGFQELTTYDEDEEFYIDEETGLIVSKTSYRMGCGDVACLS